jgi:hypothetical protein
MKNKQKFECVSHYFYFEGLDERYEGLYDSLGGDNLDG